MGIGAGAPRHHSTGRSLPQLALWAALVLVLAALSVGLAAYAQRRRVLQMIGTAHDVIASPTRPRRLLTNMDTQLRGMGEYAAIFAADRSAFHDLVTSSALG